MSSDTVSASDLPIVCDPTSISPDERERWVQILIPHLYGAVEEIKPLPDGYALRLPNNRDVLMLAAEELDIDRRCCPFVRYTLEIEPAGGPFWLSMTGGEGVKEFLWISFESANYFDAQVAKTAGLNLSNAPDIDSVDSALAAVDSMNARFANAANHARRDVEAPE